MLADDIALKDFLALYGLNSWNDGSIWSKDDLQEDRIKKYVADIRPKLLRAGFPVNVVKKLLPVRVNSKDMNGILMQVSKMYGYKVEAIDFEPENSNDGKRVYKREYRLIKIPSDQTDISIFNQACRFGAIKKIVHFCHLCYEHLCS